MEQFALQLEPVRARKRDPITSQEAASKVREFAAGHYARIMAALREGPGTYVEIAERSGLERHAVGRRLPEMSSLGVYLTGVKRDGMREWGSSERPGLPHHRAHLRIVRDHPRIDERRDDPLERNAVTTAVAVAYVAGVIVLVLFAFGVVA